MSTSSLLTLSRTELPGQIPLGPSPSGTPTFSRRKASARPGGQGGAAPQTRAAVRPDARPSLERPLSPARRSGGTRPSPGREAEGGEQLFLPGPAPRLAVSGRRRAAAPAVAARAAPAGGDANASARRRGRAPRRGPGSRRPARA